MAEYAEGQRLKGSDGNIYVVRGGVPVLDAPVAPQSYPGALVPSNPNRVRQVQSEEDRQNASAYRDQTRTDIAARGEGRDIANKNFDHTQKLKNDYDALPAVKEYRTAISQLAQALRTKADGAGDNALIYAYAKVMDPGSVVRESEMQMAGAAGSVIETTAAQLKKQLGIEGGGQLSPEVRDGLRREMIGKVKQFNTIYNEQRARFSADAQGFGVDPARVVGKHDGAAFMPVLEAYDQSRQKPPASADNGQSRVEVDESGNPVAIDIVDEAPSAPTPSPGSYQDSYAGQGMSGINTGLADVAGAPIDVLTMGMNLIPRGINALANTDLDTISNPIGGGQWFADKMRGWGIYDETNDPSKQFARRVSRSAGASLVPAAGAGSFARSGAALLSGVGGGVGAATARQVFPGSPIAEFAGEAIGGGIPALGSLARARSLAQREIEAAVPTVDQLKDQASDMYRAAEARGVTADPMQTQQLADDFRGTLASEGHVSPTGRISEVYPKTREAMQLVDDYAGQQMSPTQMQTVRKIVTDGMGSADGSERRVASLLTDTFDDWAGPLAPELPAAREVASRYLTAQQLEQARELAGARAGQFTGSGYENALRTEYRGLDRANIKGSKHFSDDVSGAIEDVSRGTGLSNMARGIGRLAPTGVVSMGLGSALPGLAAGAMSGNGLLGASVAAGLAGVGQVSRGLANRMGARNAGLAELVARNGGALPTPQVITPEIERLIAAYAAGQGARYLPVEPDQAAIEQIGASYPNPLARRERQKQLAPVPGALALPFGR